MGLTKRRSEMFMQDDEEQKQQVGTPLGRVKTVGFGGLDKEVEKQMSNSTKRVNYAKRRASSIRTMGTKFGAITTNELDLSDEQMEKFVKNGIKKPYISVKPKKQQLYFLYKLIMNRKIFYYNSMDRLLHNFSKVFCCCRKKLIEKWCSKRFKSAEKRSKLFQRGKRKLTRDLDIITLIQR